EAAVIDGTGITVSKRNNGLFLIENQSYISIQGFEIRNYSDARTDIVPVGIHIRGAGSNYQIVNNRIHDIATNAEVDDHLSGADAHGIAFYGTSDTDSLSNITVEGNELYDLKLGSSEALVLNGNVEDFTVTGNIVHDINNIALDFIGFENDSANSEFDQARNGVVSNNTIYNVSSYGNPSYGNEYSAGGIYVDGGRDIAIEMNTVYSCDIGVEIASEHKNKATSNVIVRNNFIFNNRMTGIAMGGYDKKRGSTENCTIINNTLYNNDTLQDGNGEITLSYDTRDNIIKNNILYANEQSLFISNEFTENTGNVVDNNLYYATAGKKNSEWYWKNEGYTGFKEYKTETGNDRNSLFKDPEFTNIDNAFDLHITSVSPAIDAGEKISGAGDYDIDGEKRIQGVSIDIGADEYSGQENNGTATDETGRISGNVKDGDNNPVESVKIKIKGKNSGKKEKTITDEEGLFEFNNLISDTYKITAKKKGYWETKQTVQLNEGEDIEVKLRIEEK
ncbi:MAG: carboxypeptidase regulatory-like domain-containing protein, partial [Candidatus Kuenenia sp.]|nr:carboxypeptidase regulatory-like domain-containing protein [Candidatus Kuenenia sp.]